LDAPDVTSIAASLPARLRGACNDLPLRCQGAIVAAIAIVPLLGIALVTVRVMNEQQRAVRSVTHTLDVQAALHGMEVSTLSAETTVGAFVLGGDPSWLQPYEDARRRLPEQVAAIRLLIADDPAQIGRLGAVAERVETRLALLARLTAYASPALPPQSLIVDGQSVSTELFAQLGAMIGEEGRLLAARRSELGAAGRRTRGVVAAVVVLSAGGILGALGLFVGNLKHRIGEVEENAGRLARNERLLTSRPASDELGRLERALIETGELLAREKRDTQIARDELDRFFDMSLDLLCIANVSGRLERVNEAWEQTLGWTAADLTSAPYVTFVHPDDAQATSDAASRLVDGVAIAALSNRFRCRDGTYRWLSWKAIRSRESGLIYATGRDVTEERAATDKLAHCATELTTARIAAERANLAKTTFLSHMSHDLRTPLNAILGFAQLLARDRLSEDQADSVRQIRCGGEHLLQLVSGVIDITRIESGQMSLSPEPVAAEDIVGRAVRLTRALASGRGIVIEIAPLVPGVAVLADRQRVHQILLNFLSNAIKYNRPNGRVTVSLELVPPGRCRILVADTGAGLSEPKLALLFQPFERLGAEQTAVDGNGLGLALSRTIAEAMGGSVGASSVVDQGSTFWVELPTTEEPADSAIESDLAAAALQRPKRQCGTVLYIEDNYANVRLMERIVQQRPDLIFVSAFSGESGVVLAHRRPPDLIFLDLHLPDVTGEEVLRRLWQDPDTRDIPCVMLTADVTPGLARRLRAAGAREHLTKPLDVSRVIALIDQYLDPAR
jgi:PAS domain S-box-containing protein